MLVELDTTPVRRLTPSGRSRGVPETGPAQNLSPSKWRLNQVWCDVGWFNGCVYAQECSLMCFDKITNITIVETGDDGGGDVKQCFNDPIVIYIHHPPTHHGHSVKPVTKLGHNYCIVLIVDSFQTTLEIFKSYTIKFWSIKDLKRVCIHCWVLWLTCSGFV